jgi:AraC-like DNA-binding protein
VIPPVDRGRPYRHAVRLSHSVVLEQIAGERNARRRESALQNKELEHFQADSQPENALARRCRRFAGSPAAQDTIDAWCTDLGMSRRAFTRLFKRETGLSFAVWKRRACLHAALPRLLAGERVTTIAFDLGYSSPAAFTTMFKQLTGTAPDRYRRSAA